MIGTGRARRTWSIRPARSGAVDDKEALGQEDLAGEAVAEDPEDFVADIRLQAVDGQDDAALRASSGSSRRGWPWPRPFKDAQLDHQNGSDGCHHR